MSIFFQSSFIPFKALTPPTSIPVNILSTKSLSGISSPSPHTLCFKVPAVKVFVERKPSHTHREGVAYEET
jgi:hypothetical protein